MTEFPEDPTQLVVFTAKDGARCIERVSDRLAQVLFANGLARPAGEEPIPDAVTLEPSGGVLIVRFRSQIIGNIWQTASGWSANGAAEFDRRNEAITHLIKDALR